MRKSVTGKKLTSLLVAAAFLLGALAPSGYFFDVWAQNISTDAQSVKELSAGTFSLPQDLGYIKESVDVPGATKTVIHIQDAHCNYAAQRKINEILTYLTSEYGINAVNCEGAAMEYDLSSFTGIPENDIREKTADYFVKEGVVSAAEYFAVNDPRKVNLWGVEDPDLYMKNLEIYRESLSYRPEVDRYIRSIGYILDNLKRHMYPTELLEFDGNYNRYKDGKLSFKDYLTYLVATAEKSMIDTKSFPNVYLLSQTLQEEEKIDFKRANNEKDEVVDRLKKVLSRNELEELMKKSAQVKMGRISQGEFYAYLDKKAKSVKLNLHDYPELEKYVVYISIYSAVDRTRIANELSSLEDMIRASLCKDDAERQLSVLSKNLALEKNMFNISLTRDDYMYYQENSAGFAVDSFTRFIDKHAPVYKIQARVDDNVAALDTYREKIQAFYECSLERDKAFVKNIKFTDHDRPNSIIITGGFHTESLRDLFGKEKVSYVSIMPKFTSPPGYESPYLKRLAGQRTALENVVDTAIPAVLNLQVVEVLSNELAMRVEGRLRVELFRRVLVPMTAALMRGQSFILKAGKGIPVRGARQEEEKFITFPRGEGADIVGASEVSTSISAGRQANAILERSESGELEFKLIPPAAPAQAAELATPAVSEPKEPAAVRSPDEEKAVSGPAKEAGEGSLMFKQAEADYRRMAGALRQARTFSVEIALSDAERKLADECYSGIRHGLESYHTVRAKWYAKDGDWVKNLERALDNIINKDNKDFMESALTPSTRLSIRIVDKARQAEVEAYIRQRLASVGYSAADAKAIMERVRFIPVAIGPEIRSLDPALDLLVDVGTMECDRYISGTYEGAPPPALRDGFLALLKIATNNMSEEILRGNIEEILKKIFTSGLVAKPINWKSIDEQNRANRQLSIAA